MITELRDECRKKLESALTENEILQKRVSSLQSALIRENSYCDNHKLHERLLKLEKVRLLAAIVVTPIEPPYDYERDVELLKAALKEAE